MAFPFFLFCYFPFSVRSGKAMLLIGGRIGAHAGGSAGLEFIFVLRA
jgi:hypothetical protein